MNPAPLAVGLVPFAEAIAASETRGVVLPDLYYGRLQGVERAYAFSIAGIAKLDQLQQALDSLTKAIKEGQSFEQWQRDTLKAEAVLSLPQHRLDNIFRTNIQGSYARGKCVHIEENRDARPFLMYSAINDARTRPAHAAMSGHVAHMDDPVWREWTPPCGYRCRCTIISLDADEAGKRQEKDQKRLQSDPEAQDARAQAIQSGPDKGWDYSPCDTVTSDGYQLPADLGRVLAERSKRLSPTLATMLSTLIGEAARLFREASDGKP